MAGDVEGFLLLEMRDLDKLRSKLEIIMEKRMLDTCQHKYGLYNRCKNSIRRDVYICNPFESLLICVSKKEFTVIYLHTLQYVVSL